jgi:hypothetical protein
MIELIVSVIMGILVVLLFPLASLVYLLLEAGGYVRSRGERKGR